MVYMSGDSSLDENMAQDLREMQSVGSSDTLDIIVLTDSSGYDDTRLVRVAEGGTEDLGLASVDPSWGSELNLGEPDVLAKFATWAAGAYPADRYMLDLWGHGNGWPGICPDKGDFLTLPELGTALGAASATGLEIDLLSMDACQMGMAETAYEVRDFADYALLSQKDIPVEGWPYGLFLGRLAGGGTVPDVGAGMIEDYITWGRANSYYSLTLALIDLSAMDALAGAIDCYSAEAITMAGYFNPQFSEARGLTEKYDGNAQYDIAHLLNNTDNATQCKSLEVLADSVLSALHAAVLHEASWSAATDLEKANHAHGLSVWFPISGSDPGYRATAFASDTEWDEFLDAMEPFFQAPGRIEAQMLSSAQALDSDDDGLLDSVSVECRPGGQGTAAIEIYGPDGSLFSSRQRTADGAAEFALGGLGFYEAAVYLRSNAGELLNYSLFSDGLAREGLSVITGRVQSENGRGQRWISVALLDKDGETVKTAVTDDSGRYRMEIVVPRDTDGSDLLLVCGFGPDRANVTIPSLGAENVYDFTMDSGIDTKWMVRGAGILNLAGICCLVYWVAWGSGKKGGRFGKSQ